MNFKFFLITMLLTSSFTLTAQAHLGGDTDSEETTSSTLQIEPQLSMSMEECYRYVRTAKGSTAADAFAFCKFYLSENTNKSNEVDSQQDSPASEVAL